MHGFECLKRDDVKVNALRFSNMANLFSVERNLHSTSHSVLDSDPVAAWFRYVISKLYPTAARVLGPAPGQPAGSPGEDHVNIAVEIAGALQRLVTLREEEPAGSAPATVRWHEAQSNGRWPPSPSSFTEPTLSGVELEKDEFQLSSSSQASLAELARPAATRHASADSY